MPATLELTLHLGFFAGVGAGAALCLTLLHSSPYLSSVTTQALSFKNKNKTKTTRVVSQRVTTGVSSNPSDNATTGVTTTSPDTITSPDTNTDTTGVESREAFWFEENLTEVFSVKLGLRGILFESQSLFQRVQVIETAQFGRTLVMDGQTQSAEADEHIYHESLVHPAMLLHPSPKRVFIGGGGEFATAREVLRHVQVEEVVMVDIDKVACDICRQELPEWNGGAYEDPRFSVFYEDAKAWLEERPREKFDVIVLDICDPIEAGPAYKLYTQEFYRFLKSRLKKNGVVVTQSGPGAVYNAKEECFTVIHNTLKSVFHDVVPYTTDVPSFGCNWGFNMAIVDNEPYQKGPVDAQVTATLTAKKIMEMSVEEIDYHDKGEG